jgi:3',5'-cyclic AMP phosphodiesterase CpdA
LRSVWVGDARAAGGYVLWSEAAVPSTPSPAPPTELLEAGDKVEAQVQGRDRWFRGKVKGVNVDCTYDIRYDDGEEESNVPAARVRRLVDLGECMRVCAPETGAVGTLGNSRPAAHQLTYARGSVRRPDCYACFWSSREACGLVSRFWRKGCDWGMDWLWPVPVCGPAGGRRAGGGLWSWCGTWRRVRARRSERRWNSGIWRATAWDTSDPPIRPDDVAPGGQPRPPGLPQPVGSRVM